MRFGLAGVVLLAVSAIAADSGKVPSARHAVGRTGPVGLELVLLTDKIQPDEPIFVKVTLRNFSKKPMLVTEGLFRGGDDIGSEWQSNSDVKIKTYIEVADSKGRTLRALPYGGRLDVSPFEIAISTPDTEHARLFAAWKAEGLDEKAINARFRRDESNRAAELKEKKYPKIHLAPGASIESVSWCSGPTPLGALAGTCPGQGYVEFPFFFLDAPGKYRVRAVRDFRLRKEMRQYSDEWCVRTATEWIPFEIVK